MARRALPARHCTICGTYYYRCEALMVWAERNPGHRAGWQRVAYRVCLRCHAEAQSRQLLIRFIAVSMRPAARRRLAS